MQSDAPHSSLRQALAAMSWRVEPGRFTLLGLDRGLEPADLALLERAPAQLIVERDEVTLLLDEEAASDVLERHPDARSETGLVWIRFSSPMAWDLVGFLALVSARLAEAGVPIGAVCGYSRDHLFLAEESMERARPVLHSLCPEESRD